nr:MAG TPA: hypothetical protein [Caudoviricetes sp.]
MAAKGQGGLPRGEGTARKKKAAGARTPAAVGTSPAINWIASFGPVRVAPPTGLLAS